MDGKTNLGDATLLCMTIWTLCRRSTTFGSRKPKVSNTNSIKACWLSEHAFSCLATLLKAALRASCPTVFKLMWKLHIAIVTNYIISQHQSIAFTHSLLNKLDRADDIFALSSNLLEYGIAYQPMWSYVSKFNKHCFLQSST